MNFVSKTHKGRIRKENQDYLGNKINKDEYIFIVCDGLSGLPEGALASQETVKSILSCFSGKISNPEYFFKNSFKISHDRLKKASKKIIGTTVAALYLKDKTACAAWCGDSRIYQFRCGNVKWMSTDHNVLHDILNKGQSRGDIFQNPEAITRFLGNEGFHRPEVHTFHVNSGDIILVCSDGLHRFIMEPDIIDCVFKFSLKKTNTILEEKLLSKEICAPDNFSWYIIQI